MLYQPKEILYQIKVIYYQISHFLSSNSKLQILKTNIIEASDLLMLGKELGSTLLLNNFRLHNKIN